MTQNMNLDELSECLKLIYGVDDVNQLSEKQLNELKINLNSSAKLEQPNREFIDNLWMMAEDTTSSMIYSKTSMHVECLLCDKQVKCLIDTGAQTNIITYKSVKNLGLQDYIDTEYKSVINGIGKNNSIGIIPYIEINIGNFYIPIHFVVCDIDLHVDIIIGMTFLGKYQAKIDLTDRTLSLMGHKINIKISE